MLDDIRTFWSFKPAGRGVVCRLVFELQLLDSSLTVIVWMKHRTRSGFALFFLFLEQKVLPQFSSLPSHRLHRDFCRNANKDVNQDLKKIFVFVLPSVFLLHLFFCENRTQKTLTSRAAAFVFLSAAQRFLHMKPIVLR